MGRGGEILAIGWEGWGHVGGQYTPKLTLIELSLNGKQKRF